MQGTNDAISLKGWRPKWKTRPKEWELMTCHIRYGPVSTAVSIVRRVSHRMNRMNVVLRKETSVGRHALFATIGGFVSDACLTRKLWESGRMMVHESKRGTWLLTL